MTGVPPLDTEMWTDEFAPSVPRRVDGQNVSAREAAIAILTKLDWDLVEDNIFYSPLDVLLRIAVTAFMVEHVAYWRESTRQGNLILPWITSHLRPMGFCGKCSIDADGDAVPYNECLDEDGAPGHGLEPVWVLVGDVEDFYLHVAGVMRRELVP